MPGPLRRKAARLSLGCGLGTGAFKFYLGNSDVQPMVRTPCLAGLPSAGRMSITWGACQASQAGPLPQGFRFRGGLWPRACLFNKHPGESEECTGAEPCIGQLSLC